MDPSAFSFKEENGEPGSLVEGTHRGVGVPSCAFRGVQPALSSALWGRARGGFRGEGRYDQHSPGWVVLLHPSTAPWAAVSTRAGRAGSASLVGRTDSGPGKPPGLSLSQSREDSIAVPGPARPRARSTELSSCPPFRLRRRSSVLRCAVHTQTRSGGRPRGASVDAVFGVHRCCGR